MLFLRADKFTLKNWLTVSTWPRQQRWGSHFLHRVVVACMNPCHVMTTENTCRLLLGHAGCFIVQWSFVRVWVWITTVDVVRLQQAVAVHWRRLSCPGKVSLAHCVSGCLLLLIQHTFRFQSYPPPKEHVVAMFSSCLIVLNHVNRSFDNVGNTGNSLQTKNFSCSTTILWSWRKEITPSSYKCGTSRKTCWRRWRTPVCCSIRNCRAASVWTRTVITRMRWWEARSSPGRRSLRGPFVPYTLDPYPTTSMLNWVVSVYWQEQTRSLFWCNYINPRVVWFSPSRRKRNTFNYFPHLHVLDCPSLPVLEIIWQERSVTCRTTAPRKRWELNVVRWLQEGI